MGPHLADGVGLDPLAGVLGPEHDAVLLVDQLHSA
jgi:hypothetical protein